jgi:radical SAM protein
MTGASGPAPFDRAPFIVIWETTRACALACVHCRAEAIPHRDPRELTTEEARRLMDRVRAFGDPPPILVLTGGDPLRRPDLAELVGYGTARGLTVSLTPSGTAAVTAERLRVLRDAGLARLAVSLDGATAEVHDAFRRVRGSHRHTMRILDRARALGLPLQVNTTVCRQTVAGLPALARQVEALGVTLWALFFLIPVGRARAGDALSAAEIEEVLHWAAALAARAPFGVKTTEAPQFARVLAQRRAAGPRAAAGPPPDAIGRARRAVTDGNGFLFIDHVGTLCPSGFLPLAAGSVRRDDPVVVYREHPLFRALRDAERLGGRCGRCEYRGVCGGSRARAHAATGDPFAEDPGCAHEPARPSGASPSPPGVGGAAAAWTGGGGRAIAGGALPAPGDAAGEPTDPWRPATGGAAAAAAPGSATPAGGAPAEPPPRAAPMAAAGPSGAAGPVTREAVREALRCVVDPELGLSVIELGLVYGIEVDGGQVTVTMTLTTPGCPIHDVMPAWVRQAVGRLAGVERVDVRLTFDPPWTPERMAVRR